MIHNRIITENHLDEWIRRNARDAQGLIVELVWRLVAASAPNPKQRRFPLSDSIGQHGPDGVLDTAIGFDPFVPKGKSFWEIGTNLDASQKASDDYRDATKTTPELVRRESTFVFVTPLSGRRGWEHSWKEEAQAPWLKKRQSANEWQDVRVIDGTVLIDWLHFYPAVERWFAKSIGVGIDQLETPEQRWDHLKTFGDPPPLTSHLFLANRESACEKLKEVFSGVTLQLKLDTRYPHQAAQFVAAYLASMEEEARVDAVSRCLIVLGEEGWKTMLGLQEPHFLIANGLELDEDNSTGMDILHKARRAGHTVIYAGMPGGIPHPNRITLPNPRSYQIQQALTLAGYTEERARSLAQKSDGNLDALLRCIQNLSLMPEWAQGGDAAELAIAVLLGGWNEHSEADKTAVEKLSGNAYGEWLGKMRDTTLKSGAPLIQRDGYWKFVSRYEAWYALGPRIFDEHLEGFKALAVDVLGERDPQFDLPPERRYMAQILGKAPSHSRLLAKGIAESLALLGSHPKALTSCHSNKAEATAVLAVRELLSNADAVLWASLNNLLPLLAEAAPNEILKVVENALNSDPCPFEWVFQQEGKGAMGGSNYLTGLLWALETLAWDEGYLTRVVILLGELALRDPGGSWGNRPAKSLTTILLPWLPQTCASMAKRKAAVTTLLIESPEIAWKLLLSLLPSMGQISWGTRKPAWREMIPEDWSKGVTNEERWDQITDYAALAVGEAKQDISKLTGLIDRLSDLPPPAREQVLAHLNSNAIMSMPEAERLQIWDKLAHLILKHRKCAGSDWAMEPVVVDEIDAITKRIAPCSPLYLHQRLFNNSDSVLYDEMGKWEEQRKKLDNKRQEAVSEIYETGGIKAILEFAKSLKSAWNVGITFGMVAEAKTETEILPYYLDSETKSLAQFVAGFICGRCSARGWQWVDDLDISGWTASEKGKLFAHLPFAQETWDRLALVFGEDESPYWSKTYANPYKTEKGLEFAVDRLVEYGRPNEAVQCLERLMLDKLPFDGQQAVRVLKAVLDSSEAIQTMDQNAVVEIIKNLQDDPNTNPTDLFQLEWAFLPLLNNGATPTLLEQQLANDPNFFCEVIRLIFRSDKEEQTAQKPTEQQENLATNAYHLLNEWKTPPGSGKDGAFDGDALDNWLGKVKASCAESGHLDVALSKLGGVLIHAPADTDGLWIHHAAAKVLNAKDAEFIRNGYSTAWFNSRGVYGSDPTGKQERDLAESYCSKADAVNAHGYYRLADTLRELAKTYEREAERQASRDPFDEFK